MDPEQKVDHQLRASEYQLIAVVVTKYTQSWPQTMIKIRKIVQIAKVIEAYVSIRLTYINFSSYI